MNDYEKLEAIHSLLLEYLDDEEASCDNISDALYLVEEVRETYLKEPEKPRQEVWERCKNVDTGYVFYRKKSERSMARWLEQQQRNKEE